MPVDLTKLATQIRAQASISTRPGQFDALEAIADEAEVAGCELDSYRRRQRMITSAEQLETLPGSDDRTTRPLSGLRALDAREEGRHAPTSRRPHWQWNARLVPGL